MHIMKEKESIRENLSILQKQCRFFADRRLIVIENSGFFKNASPELADYIKTMPDTACFLFVENEADKRGKMYKAVKSKGRVVEMARQDEKTLLYWVAGNVKKERI